MTDQILKLTDQVFRLVFIARNIAYYKSLYKYKDNFRQDYWILIFNNFLDIAVLEWCKVFGSRAEKTHWSHHIQNEDKFRQEILNHLNLSRKEWGKYWESMKSYRDSVVAHHESNPNFTNYPNLDYALVSCYFYYEIIIKELRLVKVYDYPDDLGEYFQISLDKAADFSNTAYISTINIKDEVY